MKLGRQCRILMRNSEKRQVIKKKPNKNMEHKELKKSNKNRVKSLKKTINQGEERISKLEYRSFEIVQSVKKGRKEKKREGRGREEGKERRKERNKEERKKEQIETKYVLQFWTSQRIREKSLRHRKHFQ
jgi:hypothetical protein